LVRDLNTLYRDHPALHVKDSEPEGFQWVEANDADRSVLAWIRRGEATDAPCLVVCNFTPMERTDLRIGLPDAGNWREILNTDAAAYGGGNRGNLGGVTAEDAPWQGQPFSAAITLPPLSVLVFTRDVA